MEFKEFGWRKLTVVAAVIALLFIFAPEALGEFAKPVLIIWLCIQGGLDAIKLIGKIIAAIYKTKYGSTALPTAKTAVAPTKPQP